MNSLSYLRGGKAIKENGRAALACLFVVPLLMLSGCGYFFGPKAEENKPFVKAQESECLKDMGVKVEAYFNGTNSDIATSIDCAVQAVDDFTMHVEGQNRSLYSRNELALFIETYLATANSKLAGDAPEWTQQALNLKQIVLGGSADSISRAEVARLKSLLLRARPILTELAPHMRTLLFKETSVPSSEISAARASLGKLAELIASELDRASAGRPDWTVEGLSASLSRLSIENAEFKSWLPLAKAVKTIIIGGDQEHLSPTEWSPIVRLGAKAWGLALQVKYDVAGNDEWLGANFGSLQSVVYGALDLLGEGVRANGGAIDSRKLEALIDAAAAKKLLPEGSKTSTGLTAGTAKNLLPLVLGKLFYGRFNDDFRRKSASFGAPQLERVREIADDWFAGQKIVNVTFNARIRERGIEDTANAFAAVDLSKLQFDRSRLPLLTRAQKQMISFFGLGRPALFDEKGKVLVINKRELPDVKKSDADRINMLRTIVSAVLQGWSRHERSAKSLVGLTESEAQEVYEDMNALGRELGWMDTRNTQAGVRTFMENAIFMSSSNGDDYLSVQEGVEWFSYVMAGGKLADTMFAEFQLECAIPQLDILGQRRVRVACFREVFKKKWATHLTNLPNLVSWVKADGTGKRQDDLLFALESAGRNRGRTNHPLDSSEFRAMIPILQYLEGMFARFDQNRNQLLDHDEVWSAFPLLSPYIKKMANGKADEEDLQRTILSYILQFGDIPQTGFFDMVGLAGWHVVHRLQQDTADRLVILNVIGSFGKAARIARTKTIEEYYKANKKTLRPLVMAGGTSESSAAAQIANMFQCQDKAVGAMSDLLRENADALTPKARPLEQNDFITMMKTLIQDDPRFFQYCLPF